MRKYLKRIKYPIIKYNPIYRNNVGNYTKAEWIGYSDIGKKFNRIIFTRREYERVEKLYIDAFYLTMDFFKRDKIKVTHIFKLDNRKKAVLNNDLKLYNEMKNFEKGDFIRDKHEIMSILKLMLRNYIGQLELQIDSRSRTEIIFGFDYYMYLKTNLNVNPLLKKIRKLGLYTD